MWIDNKCSKMLDKEQTIAFVMIEDFTGKAECIFWSEAYKKFAQYLIEDTVVMVKGKSELNADALKIVVEDVVPIEEAAAKLAKGYHLSLDINTVSNEDIKKVKELCNDTSKDAKIMFSINEAGVRRSQFYAQARLPVRPETTSHLAKLFGTRNIRFLTD